MERVLIVLATIGGALIIVTGIAILLAWPVQYLWNVCLVPAVEGVNMIGFWQALGLNLLMGILFKSTNNNQKSS